MKENNHYSMNTIITAIFFITVIARFISLAISGSNERKLKKMGAVEYGKKNAAFLVLAHTHEIDIYRLLK